MELLERMATPEGLTGTGEQRQEQIQPARGKAQVVSVQERLLTGRQADLRGSGGVPGLGSLDLDLVSGSPC